MKQKTIYTVMSLLLVGLLAGCGNSSVNSSISSATSSSQKASSSSLSSSSSAAPVAVMTEKKMDFYYTTISNKENHSVFFANGNTDVPYITLTDASGMVASVAKYGETNYTLTYTSSKATLTLPSSQTAIFDFLADTIAIPDPEMFFCYKGEPTALEATPSMSDASGNVAYLKNLGTSYYQSGEGFLCDLGKYDIKMVLEGGVGYIPLQTFMDLFMNMFGILAVYNGQNVFFAGSASLGDMADSYYSAPAKDRSESLAKFTYNELCLSLDTNYALKEAHGISSFDDYFTRTGRKADLLSTDSVKADKALSYVLSSDLDDGHSKNSCPSYLAGKNLDVAASEFDGVSNKKWGSEYSRFSKARAAALGSSYLPYQVVGDTAFVTFDQFKALDGTEDYYTTAPTIEDAAKNTIALVGYSHKQILADSSIKNVVVDISCNLGGQASSLAYIASWMIGKATINLEAPLTGARSTVDYVADVNYDKAFDENDTLQGRGLHIYGLTSLCSFSCGNLLPCLLKSAHTVTLLGQRSGGGACVVQNASLADGSIFNLSGAMMLCTSMNGVFANIDSGIEPDYHINDPASFYNRSKLSDYLDTLL
jgi:hypothetical protein